MTEALSELSTYIREARPTLVEDVFIAYGELTLLTAGANVVDLLTFLRDDPRCAFVNFIDACGVDYPARVKRFDVVYHLMSPKQNQRIRVKLATAEEEPVPSVTSVYPGADWAEREAWDMYGILFTGHPDLRRILTDYGFEVIRCARISRPPVSSRFAMTTASSASSTNRLNSARSFAASTS
jgi:NADH-quinone oxidoreductase subunit C